MGNTNCTESVNINSCQTTCTNVCREIDGQLFADCNEQVINTDDPNQVNFSRSQRNAYFNQNENYQNQNSS